MCTHGEKYGLCYWTEWMYFVQSRQYVIVIRRPKILNMYCSIFRYVSKLFTCRYSLSIQHSSNILIENGRHSTMNKERPYHCNFECSFHFSQPWKLQVREEKNDNEEKPQRNPYHNSNECYVCTVYSCSMKIKWRKK